MTPVEILNKIVEAESNARSVFDEATELRDGFDKYVSEHVEAIRKQYFERADKTIADARVSESARSEAAVAELDKRLEEELRDAKFRYESKKDAVIQKIFELAVDADAQLAYEIRRGLRKGNGSARQDAQG